MQIAVMPSLQIPGQTLCYGVSKLIELATCRGFDPPKLRRSRAACIHTIKKQHVKMDIQVQRAAETLNQGNRTCMSS